MGVENLSRRRNRIVGAGHFCPHAPALSNLSAYHHRQRRIGIRAGSGADRNAAPWCWWGSSGAEKCVDSVHIVSYHCLRGSSRATCLTLLSAIAHVG